jgi:hypothetical protein
MSDETLLEEEDSPSQKDLPFVEWNTFLESVPPNVERRVEGLAPLYGVVPLFFQDHTVFGHFRLIESPKPGALLGLLSLSL